MNKPPAFQFYVDDFLGGTQKFTDAEVGLYVRLLCAQWNEGGLQDDDQDLVSYGRGETPIARVKSKFTKCHDGMLRQHRMEQEREKQRIYRESRAENGKNGGRPAKPHGKHMVSQTKAQANHSESSPVSSLQSPSPVTNTEANTTTKRNGAFAPVPKFGRPSLDEVKLAGEKGGLPESESVKFFNYYESNGWKVGRNPMRSLPHAIANWRTRWEESRKPQKKQPESTQLQETIILKSL